jgi:hypothetical protein
MFSEPTKRGTKMTDKARAALEERQQHGRPTKRKNGPATDQAGVPKKPRFKPLQSRGDRDKDDSNLNEDSDTLAPDESAPAQMPSRERSDSAASNAELEPASPEDELGTLHL